MSSRAHERQQRLLRRAGVQRQLATRRAPRGGAAAGSPRARGTTARSRAGCEDGQQRRLAGVARRGVRSAGSATLRRSTTARARSPSEQRRDAEAEALRLLVLAHVAVPLERREDPVRRGDRQVRAPARPRWCSTRRGPHRTGRGSRRSARGPGTRASPRRSAERAPRPWLRGAATRAALQAHDDHPLLGHLADRVVRSFLRVARLPSCRRRASGPRGTAAPGSR